MARDWQVIDWGLVTLSRHDVDAGDIDHVKVDDIEFVVADGDAAEALEPLKKRSTSLRAR